MKDMKHTLQGFFMFIHDTAKGNIPQRQSSTNRYLPCFFCSVLVCIHSYALCLGGWRYSRSAQPFSKDNVVNVNHEMSRRRRSAGGDSGGDSGGIFGRMATGLFSGK